MRHSTNRIFWLTIAFTLFASQLLAKSLPRVAPSEVNVSEDKLLEVDQVLEDLVSNKKLAGVTVVAARNGKVFYENSFGNQDSERERPMKNGTIFRIASMSKPITTTAAMILYEEGKFKLDDPVSQYIPSFKSLQVIDGEETRPAKTEMKIIDLMRHTSGLGYGLKGEKHEQAWKNANIRDLNSTLEEYVAKLSKLPLNEDPGTVWQYGVSIDVLGRLIEIWSGEAFDQFLEKRIFIPLGMSDTAFYVHEKNKERFAAYYSRSENGELSVQDDPETSRYLTNPIRHSGGGGLCSTAEDYMKFLVMIENGGELFGHRFLKKGTVNLMTRNHVPDDLMPIRVFGNMLQGIGYGLGFGIRVGTTDQDNFKRIGGYGWGGIASTHFWVSPKDGLCVVTLEQTKPLNNETKWAVKSIFYDAIEE
jgi:CubicO group peptidase (beta-lactamase class C family)